MAFFKNYSFEYNAKAVDIFKSTVVVEKQTDLDMFKEGCKLDIDEAGFYGIITESKISGDRLTLSITAESYARELRNNIVKMPSEFRQVNAISLIKDYLIPDGWTFEYPPDFDTSPRYISYILRNGTYISHITTICNILGLDFTVFCGYDNGNYIKTVKAFYRDTFTNLPYQSEADILPCKSLTEWKDFANFNVTIDYGKLATSITVFGAESELGIKQVQMDAEIGDWNAAPRVIEMKDTQMKRPEMPPDSIYYYYFPASPTNHQIDLPTPDTTVYINKEKLKISNVYFLPGVRVSSWENGDLDDSTIQQYFQPIQNYTPTGAIVASLYQRPVHWIESVQTATYTSNRNINAYGTEPETAAIYDDILYGDCKISVSSYLTFEKNLPAENGFVWIGSERIYYRVCSYITDSEPFHYYLNDIVRGVPACACASCQHTGTRIGKIGWTVGCPFGGCDANEKISDFCELAKEMISNGIAFKHSDLITLYGTSCPVCFDSTSPCPVLACKNIKNDTQFSEICPKGLTPDKIQWTEKYPHHKHAVVFPETYYYLDNTGEHYEDVARDSLYKKYGYIPAQVVVKGVADTDTLDKVAEGHLRLSSIPVTGSFTIFDYHPWKVASGFYPGDIIYIQVATKGRFDTTVATWYPTHWFDYASTNISPQPESEWVQIPKNTPSGQPKHWYKIKQKFVIQKTVKNQRGAPEIYFGTPGTSFNDILEFVRDTKDVTSQRHRNQDLSRVVMTSESGIAAKVQNIKTGELTWVRMVK